jgi:hypothetical protein
LVRIKEKGGDQRRILLLLDLSKTSSSNKPLSRQR